GINQSKLDLIEPQADTAEEIATVKARQAWKQLDKAVLVDDSSFHIAALKGFPGPYLLNLCLRPSVSREYCNYLRGARTAQLILLARLCILMTMAGSEFL